MSLVEILVEGCIGSLEAAGYSKGASLRYALLLFYAGCLCVLGLDLAIGVSSPYAYVPLKYISRRWKKIKSWRSCQKIKSVASAMEEGLAGDGEGKEKTDETCPRGTCNPLECDPKICDPNSKVECPCHDEDPDATIHKTNQQGNEERETVSEHRSPIGDILIAPALADSESVLKLKRMGVLVALSMAIHNFPEGMAVFLGALKDTGFGASIAIAIAMHNIPEGFCISLPVYYATGSKWKAFFWTLIPSLAEPIGGLLTYLAFHDASDLAFGIAFGMVAGIMVYVSVMELLPAAFKFDPENKTVTIAAMLGMVVMGLSLILLSL